MSIDTAAEVCAGLRSTHVHTPLLANALLMINDHNENVHTSLSHAQVLHRDKHDKNKGCPFLGGIFSSFCWFIYLKSTGTDNIWIPGNVPHIEFQSVNNYTSVHMLLPSAWILFSDKLVRIKLIDATAQVLPNQCQQPRARGRERERVEKEWKDGRWEEEGDEVEQQTSPLWVVCLTWWH